MQKFASIKNFTVRHLTYKAKLMEEVDEIYLSKIYRDIPIYKQDILKGFESQIDLGEHLR